MSYLPAGATGLRTVVSKTGAYTAAANDVVLCDATTAAFAVTSPAPGSTVVFDVKKVDASANAVTITPVSGTIDGGASVVISTRYQSVTVRSDGTNFFVV